MSGTGLAVAAVQTAWNPRYRRYAAVHGRTPHEQLNNGPLIQRRFEAWTKRDDERRAVSGRETVDQALARIKGTR